MDTRSHVARRSFEASTQAGRAYLQERIATFARVMFFLMGAYYLFILVVRNVWDLPFKHDLIGLAVAAHALAGLGALWIYAKRKLRSELKVRWMDFACAVDPSALIAVSVYMMRDIPIAPFGGYAGVSLMIFGRALIVPSTGRRTAFISTCSAIPLLAAVSLNAYENPSGYILPGTLTVALVSVWCGAAIILSAYGSEIIYGLREQVREAKQLGQYTLIEKIGEGGMGAVYRAKHAMLRRPTAVKLLPPDKAGDQHLERFEREVQHTAELTHPNTVHIYDYGRSPDGVFYYAMELLEGIDLDDLVETFGPQRPERVVHLLQQICGSLAEAHDQGLVHRDVKPANIYLCQRGGIPDVVKVLDFGLVKELERDGASLTDVNVIAGTPAFLAPEAITAPDKIGPASDIYAVGAVAYFLLTGEHVFTGATVVEVCGHHVHSEPEPPSSRIGKPLNNDLESLILECLAKDPERRPESVTAILDDLEAMSLNGKWTVRDARRWWSESGEAVAGAAASSDRKMGFASTMQVDLTSRAG